MEQIKCVIFDWGGVLIDEPRPYFFRFWANKLAVPVAAYQKAHLPLLAEFETGRIDEKVFWSRLCSELNVAEPQNSSLWREAFEVEYRPREQMFSLAEKLHNNGYVVALLSNTEMPSVKFFREQNYDMFDELIFSCEEGFAKPDRRIYQIALERLRIEPGEGLFIDDRDQNIEAAKQLGLQAVLFESIDQLRRHFNRLGIRH